MSEQQSVKPHLVIVGAGFAGLYVLRYLRVGGGLKYYRVTLLDPNNYFIFSPLLHEVATGSLSPANVAEPLRRLAVCQGVSLRLAKVVGVNLSGQQVNLAGGENLAYDYLVVAPGATTNWYNTPGVAEQAWGLKSLPEAIAIKNHLIDCLELAAELWSRDKVAAQTYLRWVVVGGGPTGVEMAAELAELKNSSLRHLYPQELVDNVTIILLEKGNELIKRFSPRLRGKALKVLQQKGVQVQFGLGVVALQRDQLSLSDGSTILSAAVIWVAGVKPVELAWLGQINKLPSGQIAVDNYLRLPSYSNVFILGDAAAVTLPGQQHPLPGLAQVATQQAKVTAENLISLSQHEIIQPFTYHQLGTMFSLGQWRAAAEVGPFLFGGTVAWWLWRTVYLSKLLSWRKKLRVMIDWTINIFLPRDLSRY